MMACIYSRFPEDPPMTRRFAFPALVAMALLASGEASAKIYKCKNAKGEIYYTQTYDPTNCAGGGA